MVVLEAHPVADIFPLMEGAALEDLAADIAAFGLREPLWLHQDGRIIDGRNRYAACQIAAVEPATRVWDGEDAGLVAFVVSLNLHRRHLNASQISMVGARIATLGQGARTDISAIAGRLSQPEAAAVLNTSVDSIGRAAKVLREGAPSLITAVERGDLAVSAAAQITDLEPEVQAEIVALPIPERREAIKAHVAHNSGNNEWYTPAEYVEAARTVLGDIDLDPASCETANSVVKAAKFYSVDDDGLTKTWKGRVWMNPPYAQPAIGLFATKLAESVKSGKVPAAIVLVNNASDTQWFATLTRVSSALCLVTRRVRFWSPEKGSAAPLQGQAIFYMGSDVDNFKAEFSAFGPVWSEPVWIEATKAA